MTRSETLPRDPVEAVDPVDDGAARVHARTGSATSASPVEPSRLGVYAALGATASSMPLPWVPDSLSRRVRGALVQDIAMRHGLSLTRDARDVLAEPAGPDGPRSLVSQLGRYASGRAVRVLSRVVTRRLGLLWPLREALAVYTLGHLFDRYLESSRPTRAVRIDVEEARHVRQAIEGALARALTVVAPPPIEPTVIDDQRDALTALVDGLLSAAAGVPSMLVHRLDVAFDELLGHARG